MVRYEMIRETLATRKGGYLPLRVSLPRRAHGPNGLCVAVVRGEMRGSLWNSPLPLVSVSVGDGQPLFEGIPAVTPLTSRIRMGGEFIPLAGDELNGAELRVVPICPAALTDNSVPELELAIILRYDG